MKLLLSVLTACIALISIQAYSAQTATTRMFCLSVRVNEGFAQSGWYSLNLSAIELGINGELYPLYGSRSHFSYIVLHDEIFDEDLDGVLLLDVPTADVNSDGFDDFFDVARACSGTTSGSYSVPGESGAVSAVWSRTAGSYAGTVSITLQYWGTFQHTFNILEYKGSLSYTPGQTTVTGSVNLALTGVPGWNLQGPVSFTKSATAPFNQLALASSSWTNGTSQQFPFYDADIERDTTWPTNYYGVFEFDDWSLDTAEPDYYLWMFSTDDLNDSDSDGIPDFSDDPRVVAPRAPRLSLNKAPSALTLTISGDIGTVCEVTETTSLTATEWPTVLSITLTNDPQAVTLPAPTSGGSKFWRIKTQ